MRLSKTSPTLIPAIVRIGVTGHRSIPDEQVVQEGVRNVLAKLDQVLRVLRYSQRTYTVVSPLAEGADRLAASEVLAWQASGGAGNPRLEVVLPLPEMDYLQDFKTQESKDAFKLLLGRATSALTLGKTTSRVGAYEQVGRYVVDNCDVLLAIWNGKPAAGQGGTAEIVEYARRVGRLTFWINSEDGLIQEEGRKGDLLESLKYLDIYNSEHLDDLKTRSATEKQYHVVEEQAKQSGIAVELLELIREHLLLHFVRADLLALNYQRRYTRAGTFVYVLAALAVVIATTQTLFIPQLAQLLWFEVAAIALVIFLLWATRAGDWHRKWIDYRFLAERLRAALFLSVAGIECELPKPLPHLSLSNRPDDWMIRAFARIWNTSPRAERRDEMRLEALKKFLLEAWVADQATYYNNTSAHHGRIHHRLARGAEVLFFLTLFVAGIHAAALGESLAISPLLPNLLASLAIILPVIGAALGGIRVHSEYLRNAERYGHMARYLSTLGDQIRQAQDLETLTALSAEANEVMLRENQDWRVLILSQELHAA